jgi:hypothetical protein
MLIEVSHYKDTPHRVAHGRNRTNTSVRIRPTGHITTQITITYTRRGHRLLHRLNLWDDTHLTIIKQHYPQFLTLKKVLKIPLAYARPNRRGQQFSLTNPVYSETATFHPHSTAPATSRKFTHTMFSHHPSPLTPSTRTRKIPSTLHTRQSLRRSHIQCNKIIQAFIRGLLRPRKRAPRFTIRLKTFRHITKQTIIGRLYG